MAVRKRLRYEVLRRDNHTCRYCGSSAPDVRLTVDHVIPTALGGPDEPGNLVAACVDCNAGKSSSNPDQPLVEDVSADAIRWARAMERAAEIHGQRAEERGAYVTAVQATWDEGLPNGYRPDRADDWEQSLLKFQELGLPLSTVLHLTQRTFRNQTIWGSGQHWRYLCGCCWAELRDMQNLAGRLIAEEATV